MVFWHVFILESEMRNREITDWFLIENILKDNVHYLMTRSNVGLQHGGGLLLAVLYSHVIKI